jgi:membrane protease YdiL (CAAX protease family)
LKLTSELKELTGIVKRLDRKAAAIFLAVAVLQTISWYFTSRNYFKISWMEGIRLHPDKQLNEYLYWFTGDFFTFFIVPALIIKFYFRERLSDYGLRTGDYRSGLKYSLLFLIIMFPIVWLISAGDQFSESYPHVQSARNSWQIFFIYQTGMLLYMFAWEFIWRGFMLFGLEERFGYYTVLIQMLPFLILHNGKPLPETAGAIVAGIALGILALRTRSIFYCVLVHSAVMFSMDLISTLRFRANDYGTGISSFINIFGQ